MTDSPESTVNNAATDKAPQARKKQKPPRPAVAGAGIVIIDKPEGMTSHDIVHHMRRAFHTRRVGHAGTLDPMATGVLVLGIERATKLLGILQLETKSYTATIRLGAQTVTDDREGEILSQTDASHITPEMILAGVEPLTGDIAQVPSSVSAIKIDGERAYKRIRQGEEVQLKARPVHISRFDVNDIRSVTLDDGLHVIDVDVEVDCSSGTYIRALARDLGAGLGVGGHLTALRRTRVGCFDIGESRQLDDVSEQPSLTMTLDEVCQHAFPVRHITSEEALGLSHGKWLEPVGIDGAYTAVDPDGRSIAILKESGQRASSIFVIRPATLE